MSQPRPEAAGKMVDRLSAAHTGPDAISKAILKEVGCDPVWMRAVLAEVLPSFVRPRLHQARVRAARKLGEAIRDEAAAVESGDEPTPTEQATGGFVSRRVQAIHDAYEALLRTTFWTERGWLELGKCTEADLLSAARLRRDQAASNLYEAERLERLAAAEREYGAASVAELPEHIVKEIMQRSAA